MSNFSAHFSVAIPLIFYLAGKYCEKGLENGKFYDILLNVKEVFLFIGRIQRHGIGKNLPEGKDPDSADFAGK